MDQPESEGVRLLSFDGGDIRAVSQLIILDEFMRRIEWDRKSDTRILPCDYFHMMGGVGTGGIIVMLLAVLRIGIEEAIQEFIEIWTDIFADAGLDQAGRSAKFEATIKDLLERRGLPENQKLYNRDEEESRCKMFVCAVPESNLGTCEKFRSYRSRETSTNPTIIEAIRATCAIPTLFTPVSIESVGCQVSYVTGAYNFNNPAWETIKEACESFGQRQLVACMLSLGCGQRPTSRLSQKSEAMFMDLVVDIASDSELVDKDLAWRIGKSDVYYRLSVDRVLKSGGDPALGLTEDITSSTKAFLEYATTADKVNQCTKASECLGRVTLTDIAGLNEPRPATAYGLPSLSAFFVERPGLIKQMAQCLFRVGPPVQRRIVLSGMGGIGKTQITISFLHQFLSRFRHILFIDASSVQSIESGVVAKVKSLGISYSRASASEALDVLANPDHEITRDWAIIYDNVDNRDINIADYFPRCSFGTIFITTRNHSLGNLARKAHLRLDVMPEDEAVDVLLRSAFEPSHLMTEADENHAREIAKELGYLPVALVQAGYFIKIHDCMHDYQQRLKKRRPDILSRPAQDQLDPHYHGVYATLNVTWPHLSPRAQNFMSILGFVNYTGFPIVLLYRAADRGFLFEPFNLMDRPTLFQRTVRLLCATFRRGEGPDAQDIDDLVAELERYSLVTRTLTFMVTTLRLHPLVHSWTHDRLSEEEKDVYRAAAIRLLVCGTDYDDQDLYEFIYPHVILVSDRLANLHVNGRAGLAAVLAYQGDLETAIKLWEGIRRKVLALHGREDSRSGEANLQLAFIYRHYSDVSSQEVASILEKEVVDVRKQTLGSEHPVTMQAVVQLASGMARDYGKQADAASILRDALEFWERQHGGYWETVLRVKEELARCCAPEECVRLRTEVLQARMERSGPDHHATLRAMENLARAYSGMRSQRNVDEKTTGEPASDTWISVVAARTNKRGVGHPDTLKAMESLAWSYGWKDHEKSVAQWEKVIELRKAVQGASHRDTLQAMEYLELCYLREPFLSTPKQKDLRQEIVCLRKEAVRLNKEALGPSHRDTLYAMKELAIRWESWKVYNKAEELRKEIICLTREARGTAHEDTFDAMRGLVKVYTLQGEHTKVEELWREIVSLRSETQGSSHGDTIGSMTKLAKLYQRQKKYTESERQWEEVVQLAKDAMGPSHRMTLYYTRALAQASASCERYTEAISQLEGTLHFKGDADNWSICANMQSLADLYERVGETDKALAQWEEIVQLSKAADTWETFDMERLAKLYQRCKQYAKAAAQWEEIVELMKGTKGPSHYDTVKAMTGLAKLYQAWGKYGESEDQWKAIVQLSKDEKGPHDRQTLTHMNYLACACEASGEYTKAMAQREEITHLTREAYGLTHDSTGHAIAQLARISGNNEAYDKWEMQFKEAVRLVREEKGPSHEDTIGAMAGLARLYQECGKYTESEGQWKEVICLTKEVRGLGSLDTLNATIELAAMYEACKRYTEAITQIEEIVEVTKDEKRVDVQEIFSGLRHLAELYERCEQYTDAATRCEEMVQLTKDDKNFPPYERLENIEFLARMYMKLERYEEAQTILLDARDWAYRVAEFERYVGNVESIGGLLYEVRSRLAHRNTSSTA